MGRSSGGDEMCAARKALRTVLIVLAMTADLLALAIFLTRPTGRFAEHLGLGPADQSPLRKFVAWTHGHAAPWTPLGFLSIFEPMDVILPVSLLFVFAVLAASLAITWAGRSGPLLARVQGRIHWPSPMHFRVSAALVGIAILGLVLKWEVNGRQLWRLRERYLGKLTEFARQAEWARTGASRLRGEIARIESPSTRRAWAEIPLTKEALAASRAAALDGLRRDLVYHETYAGACEALVRKYQDACKHPRAPVDPDPPLPEQDRSPSYWLLMRDYRQALDAFEEKIRRYPELCYAHRQRAWILATCPDPRFRDGKSALESATRACELSRWKDEDTLQTLAAAHAEAGDFKTAVEYQKKAVEHVRDRGPQYTKEATDRLGLYQAGKPYRMPQDR